MLVAQCLGSAAGSIGPEVREQTLLAMWPRAGAQPAACPHSSSWNSCLELPRCLWRPGEA